jgi:hypothetical protein
MVQKQKNGTDILHISTDPQKRVFLLEFTILATQEAEIRRIAVQSQPGQIVCETPS